ncbi:UDP-2,3-diacylglucosamine diphosphatase [Endozoicomonas sp. G2_1]|uniref:UDP-2,3-diacylglucosamine diphosphatase n=1 Tax=Endozoicomonas sp. G2_1 TaxID=2821091 RepID=UPI001ADC38D1|nr:UDP-2,3-diacylglucosamine diphosphatase [Endozoicomonas sp. G2_1]MBO9491530.1 UDP-2,3-diacylglucosamine diphosphatase [Endozoicomonas sp. G2_1]
MTTGTHYKTVWLSDIHLGYKDCKAEYLLDFLQHNSFDTLYLVGDIVDMWAMSKRFMWPESHNQLLHTLLQLSHQGTKVIYLPGNHDAPAQKYDGMHFGEVEIHREYIHTTADGKKLLLLHGDQFDPEVCFGPIQAWLGDKAYDFLLFLNRWYNKARAACGFPYWSLAGYIKGKIKGANVAIERYKNACRNRAKELGVDGVVCGHIHHPEIDTKASVDYCNTGDWIENCSALIESENGQLSLLYWAKVSAQIEPVTPITLTKADTDKKAA